MSLTKESVYATLDVNRLYYFLTHYMKLDVYDSDNNLQVIVLSPEETAHNWWKIIISNLGLTIDDVALPSILDKINNEADTHDVFVSLRDIINSPTDKTVVLFNALPLAALEHNDNLFSETVSVSFFETIDEKFNKLYNFIEAEFGFIARQLTHAAEDFSRDVNKDKIHDIYLGLGVSDDPTLDTEFFLTIKKIPAHHQGHQGEFLIQDPMTEEEKEELFGYLSRDKNKAERGVTLKYEMDATVSRLNARIKEFLSLADNKEGYERTYIWKKVHEVLVPSIVNIQLAPFAVFAGFLGNVDKIETDEVNKIKQTADDFITALFLHLSEIPPAGENFDHYAIEQDTLKIYARDHHHKVIGEMAAPQYRFSTVFEPFYSEGFLQFATRHLKTIKNKYVFSKLGEIVKKSTDGEPQGVSQTTQKMEAGNNTKLH